MPPRSESVATRGYEENASVGPFREPFHRVPAAKSRETLALYRTRVFAE
jgi:hypothetical protein